MMIFINNMNTTFCQITLRMKTFIHKRKVVPFLLPHSVYDQLELHNIKTAYIKKIVIRDLCNISLSFLCMIKSN